MPGKPQIERKLAAIMFTDIAGYTAQMSKDEAVAISLLETKKKVFRPLLKKHNGKLVKEMGDGTLSHFPSSIDATNCSIELQKSLKKNTNLNVRVGVHQGEVLFKDKDVYGDVVNIASRLETISPAGGVLVSKNVYDELSNRKGYDGVSLGLQSLKGIGRLIEVFGLKGDMLNEPSPKDYIDSKIDTHSDKEVPSIAIIPFENKGKEEDVFYAYGISADLISDCSGAGLIRVASLKDIENLEYKTLDTSDLASKLFVRYIATGSLWKMDDMFQLAIELYDTKDKKVVWSDRWQEKWDNLPTIKGSLSDGLLKALDTKPKVEQTVATTNPEAYEYYLRAKHKYDKRENTDDTEIARGLLKKACDLDDSLIAAKVILGKTYLQMGDYDEGMDIYTQTLKQAEELDDKKGIVESLNGIGSVHYSKGGYDTALDYFKSSLAIAEELGDKAGMGNSLNNIGTLYRTKGNYNKALDYYNKTHAILKEIDDKRMMGVILNNIGIVYKIKGNYNKTLAYYKQSLLIKEEIGDKRGMGVSLGNIGNVYCEKGDYDKALDYYNRFLKISEELGDKAGIGDSLDNIGILYKNKGDYNKALDYHERSYAIREEIGNKRGMGFSLNGIGLVYKVKGDQDKALDYYNRSLAICEELGDKHGMGGSLGNIGNVYKNKGDYNKALDYHNRSYAINEEIGYKLGMGFSLGNLGIIHYVKGDYNKAKKFLEKSFAIQKEIGLKELKFHTTTYLYLSYKHLSKDYDLNKINSLITDAEDIEFEENYALYELLEDKSYLETAFNQLKEKASAMDKDLSKKFLTYPIPKAIVEAYKTLNKGNN